MKVRFIIYINCLFLILLSGVGNAQNEINSSEKYDIRISIYDTIDNFKLIPLQKDVVKINQNLFFKDYHLSYTNPVKYNPIYLKVSGNFYRTPQESEKEYTKATINLGFWNFRPSFDFKRITLPTEELYPGSNIHLIKLLQKTDSVALSESNTYLITIPFSNNREIDSIFPGLNRQSRILFLLWTPLNHQVFPNELNGLDVSITSFRTGETRSYNNVISQEISVETDKKSVVVVVPSSMDSGKAGASSKGAVGNKSKKKPAIKTFSVSFRVKGPTKLNLNNIKGPEKLRLSFPEEKFYPPEKKYWYLPLTDEYNQNIEFAKMWILADPKDFVFYLSQNSTLKDVSVYRAAKEKSISLIFTGYIPNKVRIKYRVSSILYHSKDTLKEYAIKGKDVEILEAKHALVIPDTIIPNEEIVFKFYKPFNYNVSKKGENHDWIKSTVDLMVQNPNDTILECDFQKNPSFEFFYIDLSGFKNLQKIKDLLKEKIGEQNNDYFIFVSNSSRPLIWEGEENDLDELLTRISLMRPEPASYHDEKRFIKPYIDEMTDDESIYSIDRREVHFNFLFSQSFLNYSGLDFIQDCMGNLINEKQLDEGKVEINLYSTVEKPSYSDKDKEEKRKKVYYSNIKTIKEKATYINFKNY